MGDTYPVSILAEGPAFTDELRAHSGQIPSEVDGNPIESIYLVPTKSAANGVYKLYFTPTDRQWALVRLARRYRWLLEVQLLRGMSGERQLLNQGLTGADLEFLQDIIPLPEEEYSTIVYDMLWVAAELREYLQLAREMKDQTAFTPREIIEAADGVTLEEASLFTRFLRSHLITPVENEPNNIYGPSTGKTVERSVRLDRVYKPTSEGNTAIPGIVNEYDRIFDSQKFKQLLINPDVDPAQHFKSFEPTETDELDIPTPDLESTDGILGEIASEFIDDPSDDALPK